MSQRFGVESAMIECQRLWDETRDVNACVARYPQYESDIRQHFALVDALRSFKMPPASERRRQQGWQELGSLVAFGGTSRASGILRYAGIAAGLVLGVTAISAAGAATNAFEPPSPVSNLIEQIGTIPEYIGVREAPLPPPPPPAQPTATPTRRRPAADPDAARGRATAAVAYRNTGAAGHPDAASAGAAGHPGGTFSDDFTARCGIA